MIESYHLINASEDTIREGVAKHNNGEEGIRAENCGRYLSRPSSRKRRSGLLTRQIRLSGAPSTLGKNLLSTLSSLDVSLPIPKAFQRRRAGQRLNKHRIVHTLRPRWTSMSFRGRIGSAIGESQKNTNLEGHKYLRTSCYLLAQRQSSSMYANRARLYPLALCGHMAQAPTRRKSRYQHDHGPWAQEEYP